MKQIISILVLCVLFTSCKTEEKTPVKSNGYYISGTAPGVYNGIRAYIETTNEQGRRVAIDTAIVMNEKFVFDGKVDYPDLVYLKLNGAIGKMPLIIENKEMSIDLNKDNIVKSKVSGSEANKALTIYNRKTEELSAKGFNYSKQLRSINGDENNVKKAELQTSLNDINQQIKDYPFEFTKQHKDNVLSAILLKNLANERNADILKIENALNDLGDGPKNSVPATLLKSKIQMIKAINEAVSATQIGEIAPDFSAPTPDGKMLALNEVKGKLTLIDFWASWCKPCRRENPNVVKVYNKYHKKGLEIISVSLDGSRNQRDPKAAWVKAIQDDKLTWSHVSNLMYFNDPIAKSYNIQSIPATYLLNEEGRIVAKNLRGPALEQKIAEYLN